MHAFLFTLTFRRYFAYRVRIRRCGRRRSITISVGHISGNGFHAYGKTTIFLLRTYFPNGDLVMYSHSFFVQLLFVVPIRSGLRRRKTTQMTSVSSGVNSRTEQIRNRDKNPGGLGLSAWSLARVFRCFLYVQTE